MARKTYTPELANRSLPLVRGITADLQKSARAVQAIQAQMQTAGTALRDELEARLTLAQDQFAAQQLELEQLGVELKDPLLGLLDFRARRAGKEVYLCWRLGEDAVGFWHTLDGGFAARRPLSEF